MYLLSTSGSREIGKGAAAGGNIKIRKREKTKAKGVSNGPFITRTNEISWRL